MLFQDIPEDPTSISKRERMLKVEVASTPRREDTIGLPRLLEETPQELVE